MKPRINKGLFTFLTDSFADDRWGCAAAALIYIGFTHGAFRMLACFFLFKLVDQLIRVRSQKEESNGE